MIVVKVKIFCLHQMQMDADVQTDAKAIYSAISIPAVWKGF